MRDLRPLLAPRSVAIVGASSRPGTVASLPLANLQRQQYEGAIYPVNPSRDEIGGLRCYPSVEALPEAPDVALIVAPTAGVLPAMEGCARRGVRAAIVISAGFAEAGPEGIAAQARMAALARGSGMVLCGPNSIGALNFVDRIPLSFTPALGGSDWTPGRIAFVSQSGGLLTTLANRAFDEGIGLSYGLSMGNEADLTASEALAYLAEDPHTDALVALVETIRDSETFRAACDRLLVLGKPLVVFKIGQSAGGAAAARSHTGALAGSYAAFQAVCRQYGVIEAHDLRDLFELAAAAAERRLPAGRNIAIWTESGGAGAMAADRAEQRGLAVPPLGEQAAEQLRAYIPGFAATTVENPFDGTAQVLNDPTTVGPMTRALLDDPGMDSVVAIAPGTGEGGRIRAQAMLAAAAGSATPLVAVVLGGGVAAPMRETLRAGGIPAFRAPQTAVDALADLREFARARARRATPARVPDAALAARVAAALEEVGPVPTEYAAKQLLARFGVPVVPERLARSADEAVAAAEALGYPVVAKVQSPTITHKSDVGGVRLGLTDAEAVRAAYAEVVANARAAAPEALIDGVLVARQLPTPVELIAGLHEDPTFGPVVLFGLGGIWVEVLRDVAMRPVPLHAEDALDMLDELRCAPLLRGARGQTAVRPEAVQELLLALSDLAVAGGSRLSAVDINPLVPTPDGGLVALDASLVLARPV
jgi:acyl-CoA synthetase (NDP forming)